MYTSSFFNRKVFSLAILNLFFCGFFGIHASVHNRHDVREGNVYLHFRSLQPLVRNNNGGIGVAFPMIETAGDSDQGFNMICHAEDATVIHLGHFFGTHIRRVDYKTRLEFVVGHKHLPQILMHRERVLNNVEVLYPVSLHINSVANNGLYEAVFAWKVRYFNGEHPEDVRWYEYRS